MGKQLTREEFMDAPAPMHWLKTPVMGSWDRVQVDLAAKWLQTNSKGWFYRSEYTWVFEKETDRAIFKMFLLSNTFSEDYGSVSTEET